MTILKSLMAAGLILTPALTAQETFAVTGTAVPPELLKINYGALPKGVGAYDLNICNLSAGRQSVTSSEIFQALAKSESALRPIGRQIMLAAILRNQNRSAKAWLSLGLSSATAVLSILGTSHVGMPSRLLSGSALGAIIGQQLLASFSPVFMADQVQKFESEVLEAALVMDGGSCLERTVFTALTPAPDSKPRHAHYAAAPAGVRFPVR